MICGRNYGSEGQYMQEQQRISWKAEERGGGVKVVIGQG